MEFEIGDMYASTAGDGAWFEVVALDDDRVTVMWRGSDPAQVSSERLAEIVYEYSMEKADGLH
jgi:hypothetical protein